MLKVPYPTHADYNATLVVGICDKLDAMRVKDDQGKPERPAIVALMERVYKGKEDATIYGRHKKQGLPVLQGNQNDSLHELPLVIQQELKNISNIVVAYESTHKTYKVCPLVLFSFALSFFMSAVSFW